MARKSSTKRKTSVLAQEHGPRMGVPEDIFGDGGREGNREARLQASERRAWMREAGRLEPIDWRRQNEGEEAFVVGETMEAGVKRSQALVECVIDRYHERSQINDRQKEAGNRMRALWRGAVYAPMTTAGWGERVQGSAGGLSRSEAIAALRRTLLGAGLADQTGDDTAVLVLTFNGELAQPVTLPVRLRPAGHVVVAVCGIDEWAGGTRRLASLREGLTQLADYWKISAVEDA
jgi:hypothetical protein